LSARNPEVKGFRLAWGGVFLAGAIASAGCQASRTILIPSGGIRDLAGYASLRLARDGETVRTKFAFSVVLPDQAHLEVFDALGRSASTFIIRGDSAYLILPSKRAYWRGGRDEVIEKFIGFPVRPDEIAGLITGRWTREAAEDWSFEHDDRGRPVSGTRGDLSFRVLEFFPGGDFPRRWSFGDAATNGTISLLDLEFNKTPPEMSLEFLRAYSSKTWAEIERILK
jgi:hypothetical protein